MKEDNFLDYATFLAIAKLQGLDTGSDHLDSLFPEVQTMFQRIYMLHRINVSSTALDKVSNLPLPITPAVPE